MNTREKIRKVIHSRTWLSTDLLIDAILNTMRDLTNEAALAGYIAVRGELKQPERGINIPIVADEKRCWQAIIDAIKAGK